MQNSKKASHETHIWHFGSPVALNYFPELWAVSIAMLAQVEAKRPEGRHDGTAYETDVLTHHILWGWAREDKEVEDASRDTICDGPILVIRLKINLWQHTMVSFQRKYHQLFKTNNWTLKCKHTHTHTPGTQKDTDTDKPIRHSNSKMTWSLCKRISIISRQCRKIHTHTHSHKTHARTRTTHTHTQMEITVTKIWTKYYCQCHSELDLQEEQEVKSSRIALLFSRKTPCALPVGSRLR